MNENVAVDGRAPSTRAHGSGREAVRRGAPLQLDWSNLVLAVSGQLQQQRRPAKQGARPPTTPGLQPPAITSVEMSKCGPHSTITAPKAIHKSSTPAQAPVNKSSNHTSANKTPNQSNAANITSTSTSSTLCLGQHTTEPKPASHAPELCIVQQSPCRSHSTTHIPSSGANGSAVVGFRALLQRKPGSGRVTQLRSITLSLTMPPPPPRPAARPSLAPATATPLTAPPLCADTPLHGTAVSHSINSPCSDPGEADQDPESKGPDIQLLALTSLSPELKPPQEEHQEHVFGADGTTELPQSQPPAAGTLTPAPQTTGRTPASGLRNQSITNKPLPRATAPRHSAGPRDRHSVSTPTPTPKPSPRPRRSTTTYAVPASSARSFTPIAGMADLPSSSRATSCTPVEGVPESSLLPRTLPKQQQQPSAVTPFTIRRGSLAATGSPAPTPAWVSGTPIEGVPELGPRLPQLVARPPPQPLLAVPSQEPATSGAGLQHPCPTGLVPGVLAQEGLSVNDPVLPSNAAVQIGKPADGANPHSEGSYAAADAVEPASTGEDRTQLDPSATAATTMSPGPCEPLPSSSASSSRTPATQKIQNLVAAAVDAVAAATAAMGGVDPPFVFAEPPPTRVDPALAHTGSAAVSVSGLDVQMQLSPVAESQQSHHRLLHTPAASALPQSNAALEVGEAGHVQQTATTQQQQQQQQASLRGLMTGTATALQGPSSLVFAGTGGSRVSAGGAERSSPGGTWGTTSSSEDGLSANPAPPVLGSCAEERKNRDTVSLHAQPAIQQHLHQQVLMPFGAGFVATRAGYADATQQTTPHPEPRQQLQQPTAAAMAPSVVGGQAQSSSVKAATAAPPHDSVCEGANSPDVALVATVLPRSSVEGRHRSRAATQQETNFEVGSGSGAAARHETNVGGGSGRKRRAEDRSSLFKEQRAYLGDPGPSTTPVAAIAAPARRQLRAGRASAPPAVPAGLQQQQQQPPPQAFLPRQDRAGRVHVAADLTATHLPPASAAAAADASAMQKQTITSQQLQGNQQQPQQQRQQGRSSSAAAATHAPSPAAADTPPASARRGRSRPTAPAQEPLLSEKQQQGAEELHDLSNDVDDGSVDVQDGHAYVEDEDAAAVGEGDKDVDAVVAVRGDPAGQSVAQLVPAPPTRAGPAPRSGKAPPAARGEAHPHDVNVRERDRFKGRKSLAGNGLTTDELTGVRKSSRAHMLPLEYWRNETKTYGRKHKSLPTIVSVARKSPDLMWPAPSERPRQEGSKKRARTK